MIRIPLHLKKYASLRNSEELYNYIDSKYSEDLNNYLLIDEIQMCYNFEETINSLHEEERFDIYITGSNAFLLSSDLATLFRGRVFQIDVYPFSFDEYLQYYPSDNVDDSFDKYVSEGGMSGSYLYRSDEDKRKYQLEIVRSTVVKDIVEKYKIKDEILLNKIVDYLTDTVGERASIRNIANKLTNSTYKTNNKTVGAYLDYLCRCFLFYPVRRYDIKGKKYLESEMKYYLADTSFRYAILGSKDTDYGHLYENIVAIELNRRYRNTQEETLLYYYNKNIEIDFCIPSEKLAIQVSYSLTDSNTYEREVGALDSFLKKNPDYSAMIVTRDQQNRIELDGHTIDVLPVWKWLCI